MEDKTGYVDLKGCPVEVIVGSENVSYFAHEGVLRSNSKFFDAALKKEWQAVEKRLIRLPDDDPDLIYAYLQWVYRRHVHYDSKNYEDLPKLYVLGEKLLDDIFQDSVLDAFMAQLISSDFLPSNESIDIIYRGTPDNSPARRLLVNLFVMDGHGELIGSGQPNGWDVPAEFKDDLLKALLDERKFNKGCDKAYVQLQRGPHCVYHKHGDGETCHVARS